MDRKAVTGLVLVGLIGGAAWLSAESKPPPRTVAHGIGEACQKAIMCQRPAVSRITRKDWGDKWPFTANEADVVCYLPLKAAGQMVVVDGHVWAANGLTASMGRQYGLTLAIDGQPRVPQPFDPANPLVDRVWAFAPRPADLPADEPWKARVPWGRVIEVAKGLGCSM